MRETEVSGRGVYGRYGETRGRVLLTVLGVHDTTGSKRPSPVAPHVLAVAVLVTRVGTCLRGSFSEPP